MFASVKYWIWLAELLPPAAAHRVYEYFQSPATAFFADAEQYDQISGLTRHQKDLLRHSTLDNAEAIMALCAKKNIRILTWQDADYPARLREIPHAPFVLYVRGKICHFDDEVAIALAGTRNASAYGKRMAKMIASEITSSGGLVVTGIVAGCDGCAVRGALSAGGPLVCVVAGGVDTPYYPSPEGVRLLEEVAKQGTLISAAPPETPHAGSRFRVRNELMVGLTLGVVCIEAGIRSGTLQVANFALQHGRGLYVIPANVGSPSSAGTNQLLRQNLAVPILCGQHVLEDYALRFPQRIHLDQDASRQPTDPAPAPEPVPDVPELTSEPVPAPTPEPESIPEPVSEPTPEPPDNTHCETPPDAQPNSAETVEKTVDSASDPVYIDFHDQKYHFTDDEIALLTTLRDGYSTMDDLIAHSGVPVSRALSVMTLLTLRGFVDNPSSTYFILTEQWD